MPHQAEMLLKEAANILQQCEAERQYDINQGAKDCETTRATIGAIALKGAI